MAAPLRVLAGRVVRPLWASAEMAVPAPGNGSITTEHCAQLVIYSVHHVYTLHSVHALCRHHGYTLCIL